MSNDNLRNGSKGDAVKNLQSGLIKLGYDLEADGHFGPKTDEAVRSLQMLFGYTVDGIAGEGTQKLVTAQIGHGWSLKLPNAKDLALAAQGKSVPAAAAKPNVPTPTPEQEKAAAVAKAASVAGNTNAKKK